MELRSSFSLGLTGGIGSGKTTIANMFGELGASLIDTDLIAHQLTIPNGIAINAVRQQFGNEFIQPDGAMDRAKMRELVFAEPSAKAKLEQILHPLIRQETKKAAGQAVGSYLIFIVPLLVESGNWKEKVSRILVVDCPEQVQIQRVMARNGLSQDQVLAIMRNQASRQQRLAAADDVIVNQGDLQAIREQVAGLHHQYCQLAQASVKNHP
ncbi:dephospho-CoA kinase [Undibacterium sp. Jales W-56]|uniref:dephospho-CoA kinase n=1 Tax=Undibacterium sp. Jales W-56 TaxID=2897325 RepID=UPI0021CE61B1|nr:dephospho-CoA kinase [Undibacterium sp. Jales W-56]MCU6432338.1 dephospho-CoA kinase [Undibacterium sp. Jales W-56]